MTATISEQRAHTLEIVRDEEIAAPIGVVFETILDQLGPGNEAPGVGAIPMTLEPWPGGRWYRGAGDGAGHFWGSVQAIKPPSLIEICGPLFMSYPAMSNVQFRLTEENGVTRLKFTHRAMAQLPNDLDVERGWGSIEEGWTDMLTRISADARSRGR